MRPHEEVVYQIDPWLFRDAGGHGWGTLDGITEKLDYIAGLGVSVLWIHPFYLTALRDGGYDVIDHCRVDPRVGDEAAFDRLLREARRRGLEVLIELVMQHTSDRHPWFQQAREDRRSRYRDYYIWQDTPPPDSPPPNFPPVEPSVWSWDPVAGQYYRHHFYAHEPDLELAHPEVRSELERVMRFWLARGVAGFRVDAAPYMVERAALADPRDDGLWLLERMRSIVREARSDGLLLGEADVHVERYGRLLGSDDRLTHLLDFHLNNHLFLALAREDAGEIARIESEYGPQAPARTRLAWLRNHDQLDLDQLTDAERTEVMDRFAPLPSMRIYRRGIRRRLAPMLEGDEDRAAMAHALLLSLGQVPILRYGEEIGMGDEPELPERNAVRTPMQWHAGANAGFSEDPAPWRRPVDHGPFDYRRINVDEQERRTDSLLQRLRTLLRVRRTLDAFDHDPDYLDLGCRAVLAARFGEDGGGVLAIVNLGPREEVFELPEAFRRGEAMVGQRLERSGATARLGRYGYAWLRGAA